MGAGFSGEEIPTPVCFSLAAKVTKLGVPGGLDRNLWFCRNGPPPVEAVFFAKSISGVMPFGWPVMVCAKVRNPKARPPSSVRRLHKCGFFLRCHRHFRGFLSQGFWILRP